MRMPAGRVLYKDMINEHAQKIEALENSVQYGKRSLFVKRFQTDLYKDKGYAYLILDPQKKMKDIQSIIERRSEKKIEISEKKQEIIDKEQEEEHFNFIKAGIFMLISSKEIPEDEVLFSYYTRQTIEQIFGFSKSDLDILPIRCHTDQTIRGYLFLQFILLVIFIEIRKKLNNNFTVEQALMLTRGLKCKVYSDQYLVQETTRNQKKVFELCDVIVPTIQGI